MVCTCVLLGSLLPLAALAQPAPPDNAELRARVQTLEEQVRALRRELDEMRTAGQGKGGQAMVSEAMPAATAAKPPSAASAPVREEPPVTAPPQIATSGAKLFNPNIGIIGNFVAALGRPAGSPYIAPTPSLSLQESEASFQEVIDPYARADFFLAFGEEGVEVEEGYVTFLNLPGDLLLKAGKMRATFGRLNAFHNHTLPWVDRPLVMYNLLGGSTNDPDTGIKDAGVSVSRIVPAGGAFVELTGEVFRGTSGTLFKATERSDVSFVGHLRNYVDLNDATNLEIGGSYARGSNEFGSLFITQLYGTDVTLRWRPLSRAIYKSLALRTELIWSRRAEPVQIQRAFGYYVSADYQFARRWTAGLRYDWSERANDADVTDKGRSAVLTFRPSEFSQIRAQYRRTQFAGASASDELLFQLLFALGAHGAHPF
jgi:hypothetical protein